MLFIERFFYALLTTLLTIICFEFVHDMFTFFPILYHVVQGSTLTLARWPEASENH